MDDEKRTLKLLGIPKFERQKQERIANLEFQVQRWQHEPESDESYLMLADAKRRIELVKAEEPVYRYATAGPTKEVRVGETFTVHKTFADVLLRKDDERVNAARDQRKKYQERLAKARKAEESPGRDALIAFLEKELAYLGNDKSMDKFRMFEVVEVKDQQPTE